MENFQKHTEVRWLSLSSAVKVLLRQFDAISEYLEELGSIESKKPKSIAYKRCCMMLVGAENKSSTKALVCFIDNIAPVFEKFLLNEQKSTPKVHLLYDDMCVVLLQLMNRFIAPTAIEGKDGPNLASVQTDPDNQLADKDLIIGSDTRKCLQGMSRDKQKTILLGIRSFLQKSISYLQGKLPLSNALLRKLSCLNPLKRKDKTSLEIRYVSERLLPGLDVSLIQDEWKVYNADIDIPIFDAQTDRVDHFWREVLALTDRSGNLRYPHLNKLVKSALALGQVIADSERSLSVNAHLLTKSRQGMLESTITGLRSTKEALRFFDPEHSRPEKVPLTKGLKAAVRGAHAAHVARVAADKEEDAKRKAATARAQKERERLQQEAAEVKAAKKSLSATEGDLKKQIEKAEKELETANILTKDGSERLQAALENPSDQTELRVAYSMIDAGVKLREKVTPTLTSLRAQLDSTHTKSGGLFTRILDHFSSGTSSKASSTSSSKKISSPDSEKIDAAGGGPKRKGVEGSASMQKKAKSAQK